MFRMTHLAVALIALGLAGGTAGAQEWTIAEDHPWCDQYARSQKSWRDYCEVREIQLPAGGDIEVDGGKNGGIRIEGWDRDEIAIEAQVSVYGRVRDAEDLAQEIEIYTDGLRIYAEGPRRGDDQPWVVNYRLRVPRESDLRLITYNGGILISDIDGVVEFAAKNGGIKLRNLAGDVRGETQNGGLDIRLDGNTWKGEGLDVETTNGGIHLLLPEEYDARLVTGTRNGRIDLDLPGERRSSHKGRSFRTTLGEGGPLIRVVTRNGGVDIEAL